jgi:hypothetical protein
MSRFAVNTVSLILNLSIIAAGILCDMPRGDGLRLGDPGVRQEQPSNVTPHEILQPVIERLRSRGLSDASNC